jgi:hypothetical protein
MLWRNPKYPACHLKIKYIKCGTTFVPYCMKMLPKGIMQGPILETVIMNAFIALQSFPKI